MMLIPISLKEGEYFIYYRIRALDLFSLLETGQLLDGTPVNAVALGDLVYDFTLKRLSGSPIRFRDNYETGKHYTINKSMNYNFNANHTVDFIWVNIKDNRRIIN